MLWPQFSEHDRYIDTKLPWWLRCACHVLWSNQNMEIVTSGVQHDTYGMALIQSCSGATAKIPGFNDCAFPRNEQLPLKPRSIGWRLWWCAEVPTPQNRMISRIEV
jgi:hypothetical protein